MSKVLHYAYKLQVIYFELHEIEPLKSYMEAKPTEHVD